MKLLIDEKEYSHDYGDGATLGMVLEKANQDLVLQNRVWTGICLDKLPVENIDEVNGDQLVGNINEIHITSISLSKLVIDSLKSTAEYLPGLAQGFSEVAALIQKDNRQEAMELYYKCLEGFGWFAEAIGGVHRILLAQGKTSLLEKTGVSGKFQVLNNLVQELLQGFENSDWVLVGDLLEYEMAAQLEDWAQTLPVLVKEIEENF